MTIDWLSKRNPLLVEAAKAKRKFNPALTVLFYILLYAISLPLSGVVKLLFRQLGGSEAYFSFVYDVIQIIPVILIFLFVTKIEKRSLRSMGLVRRGVLSGIAKGMGLCILFWGVIIGFFLATGNAEFTGSSPSFSLGGFALLFGTTAIQASSEEVTSRGYMLVSLANRMNVIVAITIQAIIFSSLHFIAPGFGVNNFIGVALHGILYSILFLRMGNIWGVVGFHWLWNCVQGDLLVLYTDKLWGTALLEFKTDPIWRAHQLNWGEYLLTVILILAVIFWPKKEPKSYVNPAS